MCSIILSHCLGEIKVDGENGHGQNAGGGSGGTIVIQTDELLGHGRLSASGGNGVGEGGGGGGGRMHISVLQG